MRLAKNVVSSIVGRFGYELKDKGLPPLGLEGFVSYLRSRSFRPDTVIDVGVGHGTPWLYDGFPEAHFKLFEALDVFVPDMERICKQHNAIYHLTALGAERGFLDIDMNMQAPTSSTMAGFSRALSTRANAGVEIQRKRVEIQRLDDFKFNGKILLKLDVEGFELNVFRGAQKTLAQTEVIISEVSVRQRFIADVSFGTFVSQVEAMGFTLVDFPDLTPVRRGGVLSYVDAAFVRNDSPLVR
jgi:FkbM family methyltransferase